MADSMAVSSAGVVERGISVMRKTSRLTWGGSELGGAGVGVGVGGWTVGTSGAASDSTVGGEGARRGAVPGEGVRLRERLNGARNLLMGDGEGILGVR